MAEVALASKDESLIEACKTLWNNITECRMYVTGAIGSAYEGEAFTKDYHLPNDTAYGETCAAVGLIFFSRKMLDIEKDGKYADIMERAFYNCVLAGMEQDGKSFFYVNPLEVVPGISGEAVTHKHALPQRPAWFACACCPPNVARMITSIAKYAWSIEGENVYSNLFIGGELNLADSLGGKIKVETNYPLEGTVKYSFKPTKEFMEMTLAIRIPYWSRNTKIIMNGETLDYKAIKGYVYLKSKFKNTDEIVVIFNMEPQRVFAASNVAADSGKLSLMRGPLIYCAEGIDNGGNVLNKLLSREAAINTTPLKDFPGNYCLEAAGYANKKSNELYSFVRPENIPCNIRFIPYYLWGNRGLTEMRVWIPEI